MKYQYEKLYLEICIYTVYIDLYINTYMCIYI